MNELTKAQTNELINTFRWRTAKGEYLWPKDMRTGHIFNTIKMIWNHSAPDELLFEPFRHYHFGSFYNPTYLTQAVAALSYELAKRHDLTKYQRWVLSEMHSRFAAWSKPKRKQLEH